MDLWEKIVLPFRYDSEVPFFEMLVPTMDTARYGYLLEKLLQVKHSVLFTGGTGVGKVRIVIWTYDTFENNSEIKHCFTNYLKESCGLYYFQHSSFKFFLKNTVESETFSNMSALHRSYRSGKGENSRLHLRYFLKYLRNKAYFYKIFEGELWVVF